MTRYVVDNSFLTILIAEIEMWEDENNTNTQLKPLSHHLNRERKQVNVMLVGHPNMNGSLFSALPVKRLPQCHS